jgi:hypothetical protein
VRDLFGLGNHRVCRLYTRHIARDGAEAYSPSPYPMQLGHEVQQRREGPYLRAIAP